MRPLKVLREGLFHAFLLASGVGNLRHSLACICITPVSASVVTWGSPHVCLHHLPCVCPLIPLNNMSIGIKVNLFNLTKDFYLENNSKLFLIGDMLNTFSLKWRSV